MIRPSDEQLNRRPRSTTRKPTSDGVDRRLRLRLNGAFAVLIDEDTGSGMGKAEFDLAWRPGDAVARARRLRDLDDPEGLGSTPASSRSASNPPSAATSAPQPRSPASCKARSSPASHETSRSTSSPPTANGHQAGKSRRSAPPTHPSSRCEAGARPRRPRRPAPRLLRRVLHRPSNPPRDRLQGGPR